jgi:hypothetical protein
VLLLADSSSSSKIELATRISTRLSVIFKSENSVTRPFWGFILLKFVSGLCRGLALVASPRYTLGYCIVG